MSFRLITLIIFLEETACDNLLATTDVKTATHVTGDWGHIPGCGKETTIDLEGTCNTNT